jgi:tetratricopeptide (TPR) repeat protein
MMWILRLALVMACLGGAQAQSLDRADMESRIEYAWFTGDANALRGVVQGIGAATRKDGESADSHYLLALAQYRLGLLLAMTDGRADSQAVGAALERCAAQAGKALELRGDWAEAYALQGVCHVRLAGLGGWKSMINASLGSMKLDKALELMPASPRVALLEAMRIHEQGGRGRREEALEKFRHALELFEAAPRQQRNWPDWGHAEAYVWLGQCLYEDGDLLGARNAWERALIVAPEYAAARRALRGLIEEGSRAPQ